MVVRQIARWSLVIIMLFAVFAAVAQTQQSGSWRGRRQIPRGLW
jgi:hypothetical protein